MSLWKAENTLCNIRNVGRRLDSSRLIRPVRRAFRGCGRPRDIHKGIEKMNRRKFLSCAVLAATAGATGGAMALGHPLGATGAVLSCKAISELRRTGGKYAMVTMCIAGGMGAAGIFQTE
mgnify:CR=1 FL=1